jgi:hypothetical protein
MASAGDVAAFRIWAGASAATVPDQLIVACLGEAEAALATEVGVPLEDMMGHSDAAYLAHGELMRRTSRLLARRNTPESVASVGSDGYMQVPSRDPDSAASVRQLRALLLAPEGIA